MIGSWPWAEGALLDEVLSASFVSQVSEPLSEVAEQVQSDEEASGPQSAQLEPESSEVRVRGRQTLQGLLGDIGHKSMTTSKTRVVLLS